MHSDHFTSPSPLWNILKKIKSKPPWLINVSHLGFLHEHRVYYVPQYSKLITQITHLAMA